MFRRKRRKTTKEYVPDKKYFFANVISAATTKLANERMNWLLQAIWLPSILTDTPLLSLVLPYIRMSERMDPLELVSMDASNQIEWKKKKKKKGKKKNLGALYTTQEIDERIKRGRVGVA